MKWLYINDQGERRQVSAKTRSWDRAQDKAREKEEEAKRRTIEAAHRQAPVAQNELVTAEQAIGLYLDDKQQQNCEPATLYKLEIIFRKQFFNFVRGKGLAYLTEIKLAHLEEFRREWAGLSRIRVKDRPVTDYFSRAEFNELVDSTYVYPQKNGGAAVDPIGARLRALLLLMRWSGLAIRDAVTLERERLNGSDETPALPCEDRSAGIFEAATVRCEGTARSPRRPETQSTLFLLGAATVRKRAQWRTGNALSASCSLPPI